MTINGMAPEFRPQVTTEKPLPKGADPALAETDGQDSKPTSIFHQLDTQHAAEGSSTSTIDFKEAKASIFSHMNAGSNTLST